MPAASWRPISGSTTRAFTSGRPTRRRRCSPMRSSRPRQRTSAPSTRSGSRRTRSSRRRWPRWAARPTTRPPDGPTHAWSPRRPTHPSGSAMTPHGSPPGSSSARRLASARRSPAQGCGSAWIRAPTQPSRLPWRSMPSVALQSTRRTGCWSSGGWPCSTRCFPPGISHQQRTLFDEVVRPLAQEPGVTAYFVVDALRFEMGEELYRQMEGTPATTAMLRPRLAELPTVTEVGMNVLAPVARNGRLRVSLASDAGGVQGFHTGEFRVCDPETRKRAMHDRVGGATCPWLTLEEVVSRDTASLKRSVSQARLVVVHSREIDEAGEKGIGPAVFDLALQKLRAAWRVLREAGVRRFVFTSDHGFLLLEGDAAAAQAHGRRIDPQRRHVFSPVAADHTGEVRVALADLRYEGTGTSVIFPESTAVFYTGQRAVNFAHGGNSLQERVIPVLTVVHRTAAGGSGIRYGVTAEAREGVAGMHCIEARVEVLAQQSLDFGSPQEIELAVRVPDAEDVQVELCQARGRARIAGSTIVAAVGEPFELFFRLSGATDTRALIQIHHP